MEILKNIAYAGVGLATVTSEKVKETINDLVEKGMISDTEGKKIIAKSCPARAVVLLNYCGLSDKYLDYVAEQPTSLKLDYYIPGSNLKIIT